MEEISIVNQEEVDGGWQFAVDIDGEKYLVVVDEKHWQDLTGSEVEPEDLVRGSIEFLLARESKDSILKEFNLREITQYFPDYEAEMSNLK